MKKNGFEKIGMLLIGILILMIAMSPISASSDDSGLNIISDNQDIVLNEETLSANVIDNSQDNMEINGIDSAITADSSLDNTHNEIEESECTHNEIEESECTHNDAKNILNDANGEIILEDSSTQASNYTISDATFEKYFSRLGDILPNTFKAGDTLIIGNLTNKTMKITMPLNIIGSENHTISNGNITIEKKGSNSNITGLKFINSKDIVSIYLRNTTKVTVKKCEILTNGTGILLINSNYNKITNNIVNTASSDLYPIALANASYNNVTRNTVMGGCDGILLNDNFNFYGDYKYGFNHNNTISYNNITGGYKTVYGIRIAGDNNTVTHNNIKDTSLGIITLGKQNKIYYNNMTNSGEGLDVSQKDYTLNNTIDGYLVNGNQYTGTTTLIKKGTIYVDGKKGNDNNNGAKDKPFKTIKAAVNYINQKENGLYTIIVAEGTYNENDIQIKNNMEIIGNGKVTINGQSKNNIIFQRRSTYLKIKSIDFINGRTKSHSGGGAIYSLGNLSLEDCSFKNNKATTGNGGAIYLTTGTISNCEFTSNNGLNEGIIYVKENLNIKDSNFTGNKGNHGIITPYIRSTIEGDNNGGELIEEYAKINATNCNFNKNSGSCILGEGNVTKCSFTNNNGSGICLSNGTVANCIFINNTSTDYEGAIYAIEGKIRNCTFINNRAKDGGAVHGEYLDISNCTFINNSAKHYGGAVYSYNLKVKDSQFINNTASAGGGIAMSGGKVTKSSFEGNEANIGKDIFIMNYNYDTHIATGRTDGRGRPIYDTISNHQTAVIDLGDDNYWGNVSSKDTFYSEKRIANGDPTGDGGVSRLIYLAPNDWIHPNGGIGDGSGSGMGDGTGTGIGDGTGNGYGDGDGNGTGDGNGNGNGDGTGEGSGIGTGNGTSSINGNGTGLNNILSDIISNITNSNANDMNISGDITDKSSAERTEIHTDVGTYSTDPSKSEEPSQENSESSSGSPGQSGGAMKAYELNQMEKKIEISKNTDYQLLALLILFLGLIIIGYYKEKKEDDKNNKK